MKNTWYWIIGIGLVLILGLVFLLGLFLFGLRGMPMTWVTGGSDGWFNGTWGHHGMRWGWPMMGLFGGLLMLILLLGLLALVAAGVVLLAKALQQPNRDLFEPTQSRCDHCGKQVAPDWQVCPYCGEALRDK